MTEPPQDYITPRVYTCHKCGAQIGHFMEVEGRVWVRIGAVNLRYMSGVCGFCGEPFTYSSTDKTLERMFKRRNRMIKLEKGE